MDYAELKEEMKNAMKAKDKDRLTIIRQVKGDVDATVKDEGRDEVTEQDVTASLKRTLKQARETHEASVKAGTDEERTQRLAAQIEILEGMLPAQLGGEQLEALVAQTIEQTGATSLRDMGKVMGALTAATDGNFDKGAAAAFAKAKLG